MATGQGFVPPRPRTQLKWVAVDLDNTLARGVWTPDNPTPSVGPPIQENIDKANALADAGWTIVIHTARPWQDYELVKAWCLHHGVNFKHIVMGKLLAAAYVDDRSINAADADWTPTGSDVLLPGGEENEAA